MNNKFIETDVLIAGCGCSGLYMAMNLPKEKNILMITKSDCESSDSFLAQGGMRTEFLLIQGKVRIRQTE